jgi:hypothetical protein
MSEERGVLRIDVAAEGQGTGRTPGLSSLATDTSCGVAAFVLPGGLAGAGHDTVAAGRGGHSSSSAGSVRGWSKAVLQRLAEAVELEYESVALKVVRFAIQQLSWMSCDASHCGLVVPRAVTLDGQTCFGPAANVQHVDL